MNNGLPINQVLQGDCIERLTDLPDGSVQTVVTSPPYWGLRDYGIEPTIWGGDPACEHDWSGTPEPGGNGSGKSFRRDREAGRKRGGHQPGFCTRCGAWLGVYGLEPSPELYVEHTVEIFREVRRVLRDDGTLWLNLGDSYWSRPNGSVGATTIDGSKARAQEYRRTNGLRKNRQTAEGMKHKDLVGIPWRVAFALQADGWYLRQDIIWHKPNPMPESVTDRCTKAHEYIFLLSKSPRYYYDGEAIKEPVTGNAHARGDGVNPKAIPPASGWARGKGSHDAVSHNGSSKGDRFERSRVKQNESFSGSVNLLVTNRNKRSVWTVSTAPFKGAHFATFPPELIRPAILAGTSEKGCCPACGAPWVRVVAKNRVRTRPGQESKAYDRQTGETLDGQREKPWNRPEVGNRDPGRHVTETNTVGWQPGCKCDAGEPVPCIVLDPFGGSGTTGMVAAQEKRDWILIEVKPDYCEMAKQRTDQVMRLPLFSDHESRETGRSDSDRTDRLDPADSVASVPSVANEVQS